MKPQINNIEYIVPSPDKQLGSLSFNAVIPVFYKDGQKNLTENEGLDVTLSEESLELMSKLSESIIKDLEK